MPAETPDVACAGIPWEAALALLILAAAWFLGRRINAMKRPVCRRACAGCHGARQGRGCAFPAPARRRGGPIGE